jgi:hypothetical protein
MTECKKAGGDSERKTIIRFAIQAKPVARKISRASISLGFKPSPIECEESCKDLQGSARALCIKMCQY